jgi:hypothetical protein
MLLAFGCQSLSTERVPDFGPFAVIELTDLPPAIVEKLRSETDIQQIKEIRRYGKDGYLFEIVFPNSSRRFEKSGKEYHGGII